DAQRGHVRVRLPGEQRIARIDARRRPHQYHRALTLNLKSPHIKEPSMFKKVSGLLLALCLASAAGAQEGHPLVGTWQGEWGPNNANFLTLILYWDGKAISGIVNPGPDQGE